MCNNNVCDDKNNNYYSNKYEFEHFKIHSFNKAVIDILHIEPDHDRRLELENKYIVDLKTAYPYGLNDRINNISVTSTKDNLCIYQAFFKDNSMSTPKNNRVRSKNKNTRYVDMNEFLDDICTNSINKSNFVKYVKGKILGLSRSKAKVLVNYLSNFKFNNSHIKDLVTDLVKFKSGKWILDKNLSLFNSYIVMKFSHKFIDLLNIPRILNNSDLKKSFPSRETNPKISFTYGPTLGSMSFNYAKFSKSLSTINEYP